MSMIRVWTGLRTSFVALGLVAAASGVCRADSMSAPTATLVAYNSIGSSIGTTGVVGDPSALTITPLTGASFLSPSNMDLGVFQAKALADGESVTYTDTPFDFKFTVGAVNGSTTVVPNETPIDIKGVLNGTMTGANQSTVKATFNPASYTFATGLYTNTLKISDNPVSIVPSTSYNGMSTAQATLTTELTVAKPAPEPSTVLLFAATIAGLGLRRRLRRSHAEG